MNKRAIILSTAIIFGFVLVVLRLADLMLFNHERLSEKARNQYRGKENLSAGRGGILDRNGRNLAVNIDIFSVYCNPREIEDPKKTARKLSTLTGTNYRKILKMVSSDKSFVWIQRKIDRETAESMKSADLKGVYFLPEVKRFYPNGSIASHVVGFVGVDNQALEGIELQYDDKLKGREESFLVAKDAGGRMLSEGIEFQRGGNSLVLTIDEGLQYITERALDRAIVEWKPAAASAVMMNPHTGEILAMANRPTFDLNNPTAFRASSRRNRALTDSYEPGSVMKLITAAGILEEGLIKNTTKFDCSAGFIRVGRRAIWDTHNNGVLSFREVIQASSNVGTVMMAMMLKKESLYKYLGKFGFGEETGIDLPGESGGKIQPFDKWSDTTLAATSIGYGIAVTPMQLLRAYSVIANGGFLVKPHMVSRIMSPEGNTIYQFRPDEYKRVISRRTAETLREILVTVTQQGGTATRASIDGNRVAGKTGTARLIDPETGKYSTERYASSFVGFAPADNPKIAVMVVVFEPKGKFYGGRVAAPVFQEIVEQSLSYMNVPREDDFNKNLLIVQTRGL